MGLFGRSAKQWSKMAVFSAGAKIIKPSGEKANEFELSISQALLELEINSELKNQLRELFITGAKEIDVCGNKKAIVIFVHDCILEDLVFPSEIVGKRIRVKLDGTRIIKVHLEKSQQIQVDYKTDTFSAVYKKLTGKEVLFEFPEWTL